MITTEENNLRVKFALETGNKCYKGHKSDGDEVVWKEEYVLWLENKNIEMFKALEEVNNLRELIIYPDDCKIEHYGEAEALSNMLGGIQKIIGYERR